MDKRSVAILALTAWFIAGLFGVTFGFNTPSYDWFSFGLLSLLLAFTAVALLALADPPAVKHYRTKAQNLEDEINSLATEYTYRGEWLHHYVNIEWSALPHRVIEDSVRMFFGIGNGNRAVLHPIEVQQVEIVDGLFHFYTEEGKFVHTPPDPDTHITEKCAWTTSEGHTVRLRSLSGRFDVKEDAAEGVVVAKRLNWAR